MTDAEMSGPDPTGESPLSGAAQDEADPGQRIAELESQLAAAKADAEKAREDWLRAKAETDNVRRRAQDDVARAHRFGIEGFASALLAVKDSVDAALKAENVSVESFREGTELTARQLEAAFAKFAITEVEPHGEKFDPHRHQAISQVESDAEPNTVVAVLQKGFLLHDRVLRPALVIVSRPKAANEGSSEPDPS